MASNCDIAAEQPPPPPPPPPPPEKPDGNRENNGSSVEDDDTSLSDSSIKENRSRKDKKIKNIEKNPSQRPPRPRSLVYRDKHGRMRRNYENDFDRSYALFLESMPVGNVPLEREPSQHNSRRRNKRNQSSKKKRKKSSKSESSGRKRKK